MISVIVPVYRVEKYLQRCIDSILRQSYTDFELILVDDGSPDKCGEICEENKLRDNRIKVIHKGNGGLSSARNAGIDAASGQYICFVDSDDWLDQNFLIILYELIENNEADMSACRFCESVEEKKSSNKISDEVRVFRDNLMIHAITDRDYSGFACNKLFKACYIRERRIRFDESIFNGEDLPFTIEYLKLCHTVAFTPSELYFYTIRPASITTTRSYSEKAFTILYAREKVLADLEKCAPECVDIEIAAFISHLMKMKYVLEPQKEQYSNHYAEVNAKLKQYKGRILTLRDVNIKTKLKLFAMVHFEKITGWLYRKKI